LNALAAALPPTRGLSDGLERETAGPLTAPDALDPPEPVREGAGVEEKTKSASRLSRRTSDPGGAVREAAEEAESRWTASSMRADELDLTSSILTNCPDDWRAGAGTRTRSNREPDELDDDEPLGAGLLGTPKRASRWSNPGRNRDAST
jgi:hypothetical protein